MARSRKLGHCVCDPRKPCPCPLFKEKNVCTCAGERVPVGVQPGAVRLTQYVRSAGCASKIGQKDLHEVLKMLPVVEDPRLVVGTATADDAGVFRLTPDIMIVQTVDVFTPGVDDPVLFGRIAACNSLSDVYAMGGRPLTALSVIGFPIEQLPHEVMADILRGGMDVLKEAGVILLGGHSINDEEIKFGFAVTGLVTQSSLVTNAGAKPGDLLVLTKPLGTGIVSLAGQVGIAGAESIKAAADSMSSLNRRASEIMVQRHANACTDVTGFGLMGHLCRMAIESGVTVEIGCGALPVLPGALEYAAKGSYSGANERNSEFSAERTVIDDDVGEQMRAVLFDAQTSGGLLIAFPPAEAEPAVAEMREAGVAAAAIIGCVTGKSDGRIHVTSSPQLRTGQRPPRPCVAGEAGDGTKGGETMAGDKKKDGEEVCCAHGAGTPDKAMKMFQDFMGTAMQAGAVDVVTKELIAVALGLAVHCVPCTRIHIKKAKSMGVSNEELEEAAALAVAFAGCRALMLWNELKKELAS